MVALSVADARFGVWAQMTLHTLLYCFVLSTDQNDRRIFAEDVKTDLQFYHALPSHKIPHPHCKTVRMNASTADVSIRCPCYTAEAL